MKIGNSGVEPYETTFYKREELGISYSKNSTERSISNIDNEACVKLKALWGENWQQCSIYQIQSFSTTCIALKENL